MASIDNRWSIMSVPFFIIGFIDIGYNTIYRLSFTDEIGEREARLLLYRIEHPVILSWKRVLSIRMVFYVINCTVLDVTHQNCRFLHIKHFAPHGNENPNKTNRRDLFCFI